MDAGYPGNHAVMTHHENHQNETPDPVETAAQTGDARIEALQAVVDRMTSWQDTAPDGTVEAELRRGLDEAGVPVEDDEVAKLVEALEKPDQPVHVREVLA